MAGFTTRNLSVLAYANGFTLWHYRGGAGKLQDLSQPDFFEPADDMMSAGDVIMVSGADGARILCLAQTPGGGLVSASLV